MNYCKKSQRNSIDEFRVENEINESSNMDIDEMPFYVLPEEDPVVTCGGNMSIPMFIRNMDDTIEHIQRQSGINDSLKEIVNCAFQEIESGLQRLKKIANGNPAPSMEVIYHFLCDIQKALPFLDPHSFKGQVNKELELLLISENNQLIRSYLREEARRLQEKIDLQNNIDWVKKNGTSTVGGYQNEILTYFMEGQIENFKLTRSDVFSFKDKKLQSTSESDAIKRYKIAVMRTKGHSKALGFSDKVFFSLLSDEIDALIAANALDCECDTKWFKPLNGVGEKTSKVLEHLICTHYPNTATAFSIKALSLMKKSNGVSGDKKIDHELIKTWTQFKKGIDKVLNDLEFEALAE